MSKLAQTAVKKLLKKEENGVSGKQRKLLNGNSYVVNV